MIHTKLAILIVSFAFSTAAIAAPVAETGMKASNMDPANCPKTSGIDRNANPQKDIGKVHSALNIKQSNTAPKLAPVKVKF